MSKLRVCGADARLGETTVILAGDIGGTKTRLALVSPKRGVKNPVREERFASGEFNTLEAIVARFLEGTSEVPRVASLGVAGPVVKGTAKITNLPWIIDSAAIAARFGFDRVLLLNDLQAIATAVPYMDGDDLIALHGGISEPTGVKAVIAPGTGLGEAFLVWTGERYKACPTEGGHASFAPVSHEQVELLDYLERKFGHVSFERVCSGSGIPNLYDFLCKCGRYEEPEWLRQQITAAEDKTPIIMNAGMERRTQVCVATLDLFVRILGGVVGNMALKVFATGGLYLGGGIPPRIVQRLRAPDFLTFVRHKGRFEEWLSKIPIYVIADPMAALHGAAWEGLNALED